MMPYRWKDHLVSVATGPEGLGVLIAVHPERQVIEDGTGRPTGREVIVWFDADHQRAFELESVEHDAPNLFTFTDPVGRKFTLRPMDLERYKRDVKPWIPDARDFDDEPELWRFFLNPLQGWGGIEKTGVT